MASLRDQWAQLLRGHTVDGYELLEDIGGGNFSIVFESLERISAQRVAVKVLYPVADPDAAIEFAREGSLLASMRGASNVSALHKSGTFDFQLSSGGVTVPVPMSYHAMELAHGCLEELVLKRESLDWHDKLALWRGTVLGVHQMHLRNIVHRDLKSANCLVFLVGRGASTAKVADLGRGRDLSGARVHQLSKYVTGRGDLRFAPPEFLFIQGQLDDVQQRCADLYGLGSLLFELVTGQCITALALGDGRDIVREAHRRRLLGQTLDLGSLRTPYSEAFSIFRESLPAALRAEAGKLVSQLCDPVPLKRLPALRTTGRPDYRVDLTWLIRKADILRKIETNTRSARGSRPYSVAKGA